MEKEKSKTVKMNVEKTSAESTKQKKLSYEELEQIANGLNNQCKQLYERLHAANDYISGINEVEVLLSILENSIHFDEKFISRCADTIEEKISKMMDSTEEKRDTEAPN